MSQQLGNEQRQLSSSQQSRNISVEDMKKMILHDAQSFNVRAYQSRKRSNILEKQREYEVYSQQNRRLQTELDLEKEKQRKRKELVQLQLREEYQKQINERRNKKSLSKHEQQIFAHEFDSYQEHYHSRRMNDIAKMYNPNAYHVDAESRQGSNASYVQNRQGNKVSYNLDYKQQIKTLPQERSLNDIPRNEGSQYNLQNINNVNSIKLKNPFVGPNAISDERRRQDSQSYKDYLKQQIERKESLKAQQKEQKLQRQKQQVMKHQAVYQDSLDQLKILQKKQQMEFRRGLQEQISVKKNSQKYIF